MKKKIFIFFYCLLSVAFLQAQTWDGSASTDWNTPANWSTNAVPLASGNVQIPFTGIANWPVLAANTTVNSLDMLAGSQINFNGFTLTTNANIAINGSILNNTNGATDIVLTASSGTCYFGGNIINDNITINLNSAANFYEGYVTGNIYNGNANFNFGGTGTYYISYNQKSTFNGNLTINRTTAGITYIFNNGYNGVTGNFSFSNTVGGATYINPSAIASGVVGGTVNITANGAGSPVFQMYKIKNLTPGGIIDIQNSGGVEVVDDTLQLTSFTLTGVGGGPDHIRRNVITGNFTYTAGAGKTTAIYIGENTINGNTVYTSAAAISMYEGYVGSCTYNGNTTFNYTGTGPTHISYNQKSTFNGNLTINRTTAGVTNIFNTGHNGITGNFSYANTVGGATYINPSAIASGVVGGTVNITATGAGSPAFQMYKIKNLTPGGIIDIQNSGAVEVVDDTLQINSFSLTGVGGGSDHIRRNVITGNFTFAEAAGNTTAVYIGENTINGNTVYTSAAATTWYESYVGSCTYNGNTTFNYAGTGTTHISYDQKSTFNGNLTINRTTAGVTNIFNTGHNGITGNFSYANTVGGATYINPSAIASGVVGGTVNITATGAGSPAFQMYKIKNSTPGGIIDIQNSGAVEVVDDTLQINSFSLTGVGGSSDIIRRNLLSGNFTFAEAAGNTTAVYFGGNTINGNTVYTSAAATTWYESYVESCTYNGNVTVNRNGTGVINIAFNDTTYVNANLVFNSTAGITVNNGIRFGGSANAIIEQLGTQPISIPRLIINKTGGANLTLNDSVMVTTAAGFVSGNIIASANKELVFDDGATNAGASATSHVIGPVTKIGNDVFTFPLGSPVSYNPIGMSAPVGVTSRFRAEYKNQNPSIDGYNTNNKAGSFGAAGISKAGYWDVQRITGATNVLLTLGFNANPYEQYPVLANLKVAHWVNPQWDDHGNGGTTASTVVNSVPITSFSPFTLAGITNTYFYNYGNPGPGPDGTPVKFVGTGGYPAYNTKQLPAGSYSSDSIYLIANAASVGFKLKDFYGVEKDDTTVTAPAAPTNYITANGSGSVNFTGWRHFVYMRDGSGNMMGAIRDNDLTLGNTTMNTYFSTANVATSPNGNTYLKRSFKITSQYAPVGTRRVRFYISKTEFNNLQAADPASFPNGINSLTITKYTGPQEDSLFNPIPGGNAVIIPNSDITIADLGTMYSLDIDVTGFSGFYIGGNQSNLSLCSGSSISLPSDISGATYQWQADTGSGYADISDGAVYGGTTTKTLSLSNAPSTMYGYKFRCVVNGGTFSQVYIIKFTALWQGTASNVWENTANWSCGILPDANTDVILNAGKPNFPELNSNVSVRSLHANTGASITIKTGFNLTIIK